MSVSLGLHPTAWRMLRAKHGGSIPMKFYNSNGDIVCDGILFRYQPMVNVPSKEDFFKISWRKTAELTEIIPAKDCGYLNENIIPIGKNYY